MLLHDLFVFFSVAVRTSVDIGASAKLELVDKRRKRDEWFWQTFAVVAEITGLSCVAVQSVIWCIVLLYTGEDIVFLATDINLAGAVDWVMMQTCFGHHFMLVLEKQEKSDGAQMFYTIVQLIGTRKQAENFVYRWVFVQLLFSETI